MKELENIKVAVLLATYNGEPFVAAQIASLRENKTTFDLHWIDDHSTDGTRQIVCAAAVESAIPLRQWHRSQHLGVPGTFFWLLECVEADVYLFCDQDDIWQPGKIDAAVESLLPDLSKPALCFSDYWVFREGAPDVMYRSMEVLGTRAETALEQSRLFTSAVADGHSQAFTRPLRDLFMLHKEIAHSHAWMHDTWMYSIAVASGNVRMARDVPTTLFRWHQKNTSSAVCSWTGRGVGHVSITLRQQRRLRQAVARHARGFILASSTLPAGQKLERGIEIAKLVATLDRRQSLTALIRLIRNRTLWPVRRLALGLMASCLFSRADQIA